MRASHPSGLRPEDLKVFLGIRSFLEDAGEKGTRAFSLVGGSSSYAEMPQFGRLSYPGSAWGPAGRHGPHWGSEQAWLLHLCSFLIPSLPSHPPLSSAHLTAACSGSEPTPSLSLSGPTGAATLAMLSLNNDENNPSE